MEGGCVTGLRTSPFVSCRHQQTFYALIYRRVVCQKSKYCYQCGFGYTNCEYMNWSLDWYVWCVKYRLATSPSPSFKSIQIAKAIKTVF